MKLELMGITKRFGALVANDSIDLTVQPGEIVSLLGENGAGKSTLMNVLYGLYQADAGEILIDDKPVKFKGPGDAMASGIGMVHQHFMLIPVFTVAENVALGNEPTKSGGVIDLATARTRVREISDRFGFNVDPDALIQDLPVGVQQRVEIIKALSRDAQVLVLDEPTAVLTPQETDELMTIMRQLSKAGTSIIFITHKLREVQAVADRIIVIRLGKVVGEASPTSSAAELASLMVGREVQLDTEKAPLRRGDVALGINSISVLDDRGQLAVNNLSLEVHAGEVLAIAGVQGNGQTELAEAIVGLRKLEPGSGGIEFRGAPIDSLSVRQRLDRFLSYVPEDRKKDGLVGQFTIEENLMLNQSFEDNRGAPFVWRGLIDRAVLKSEAENAITRFDIRTQGSKSLASKLSGGNQQKVVLAREMTRPHSVLLVAQPTRGVDVGSIEFIHEQIMKERDSQQTAVLLISTELDEVLALADRIAVMYRGKIVGVVSADTSRETLGKMMAGVTQ
jgi:simple sugar transport system ATP-binding protein